MCDSTAYSILLYTRVEYNFIYFVDTELNNYLWPVNNLIEIVTGKLG